MNNLEGIISIKKCSPRNEHRVYQSNNLIEAVYQVSLLAKKMILCGISQIEPDDDDFKFYMISVEEFKKLTGVVSKEDYYKLLKRAVVELRAKNFDIYDPTEGAVYNTPFVFECKYDQKNKLVGFSFSPRLKPHLLKLKERGRFTGYELGNVMKMRSTYSIRLYELLKQYEPTEHKKRTFELEELKLRVGVEQGKLSRYYDFKKKVLELAKKELPEKTDIDFIYKPIKQGRAVRWIQFTIKPRKKIFINDGQGGEIDTADVYSPSDIPAAILKWIPEGCRSQHDVLRDIVNYLETHGLPYVVQKVAYTAKRKPKDFAAYLGNALKKNLGADFDPNQLELFSESALLPKIAPGMRVVYKGHEYTIDETECIWPEESDGCMTSGRIRELIGAGTIQIV
jgi:plasmid replication initiation protein